MFSRHAFLVCIRSHELYLKCILCGGAKHQNYKLPGFEVRLILPWSRPNTAWAPEVRVKNTKTTHILPHSQTSLAMDYEFSKYNPSTFSCIMILYAIPCLLDNLHWGFVWTMSLFHHCHWVPHQWCTHWGWSNIPRCLKWNYFYSRRFHHSDMTTTWKMEKKVNVNETFLNCGEVP